MTGARIKGNPGGKTICLVKAMPELNSRPLRMFWAFKMYCAKSPPQLCPSFKVKIFSYSYYSRILLATDGFSDILRKIRTAGSGSAEAKLIRILKRVPAHKSITEIMEHYNICSNLNDDLAMIIIDPYITFPELNYPI